ncbi:uncharacterized protein LOC127864074 [Dreissena polymorpha]|uniref:Uncharacterized protein n=1 Tax=Dreissena polymorpha TaxID=45954 RepID=A0A9D3XYS0_DREPO|nr:uncharacterized protein LOC127864074 [Dreissena polymorpha]KAH3689507.1 hypothetical protein DPMN_191523 [Dreissena polymorpha]
MASVLVDLEDIAYIDDIGNSLEHLEELDTDNNRLGHRTHPFFNDILALNVNHPLITELRRERQERKLLAAKGSKRRQVEKDYNKLITCIDQEVTLKELREDRATLLARTGESEQTEDKAKLLAGTCDSEEIIPEAKVNLLSRTSEIEKSDDMPSHTKRDKQVLMKSGQNQLNELEGKKDDSIDYDELQPDTERIIPKGICKEAENTNVKTNVYLQEMKANVFTVDEPKSFTNVPHDKTESRYQKLSESSTSESMSQESSKGSKKRSRKKNLYNVDLNALLEKPGPSHINAEIKIVVTNEEGQEDEAQIEGKGKGSKGLKHHTSSLGYTTNDSTTMTSDSPKTSINYFRKLSEDKSEETKVNSLLLKQELYKLNKAKPFQQLTKTKLGKYEAGIEGDNRKSYIKSMTMLPDKRFILFDKHNRCLKMFDDAFNPLDRLVINVKHCALAAVYSNCIAASLPKLSRIQLYHCGRLQNRLRKEQTLPIEGEFFSLAHYDKKLYMIERKRRQNLTDNHQWFVKALDLKNMGNEPEVLRTFSTGHKDCSILVNGNGVYVTNRLENEVILLKHDGTFAYRHKVEMSLPVGITSDRYGNIYVCGGSLTSFIEAIKPDMRKYRIIFNKTSSHPVAMCFDHECNLLYVSDKVRSHIICYQLQNNSTIQGGLQLMEATF